MNPEIPKTNIKQEIINALRNPSDTAVEAGVKAFCKRAYYKPLVELWTADHPEMVALRELIVRDVFKVMSSAVLEEAVARSVGRQSRQAVVETALDDLVGETEREKSICRPL